MTMTSRSILILLLALPVVSRGQNFDRSFEDKTLRVDFYHTGTKGSESLTLDNVYEEGTWAGSLTNLVDPLNLGEYLVRVTDAATNSTIFSRGYSTMFNEWQTTDEATDGISRTFHESVRIPCPRKPVQITVSRRTKSMEFREFFSAPVDPSSLTAVNRERRGEGYGVTTLMDNGNPHEKVDLVILGDGYRKEDLAKLRSDARHFNDVMFSTSPFRERKRDFNVRLVEAFSPDSGIDKPDKNVWKRTALGTKYNTFGSARYVLTEENRALRDIAGTVPYDFITILINDNRYGGGGIYNLYSTTFATSDAAGQEWQRDYVYVHEFGHSFGGLGDEYYSSQVSYNDFYPKGVEPWEPNLTALRDKKNLKWGALLSKGIPVPTPWEKATYDSLEKERGKLDRLAADYYEKRAPLYNAEQEILHKATYAGNVGVFEGAGYVSVGIYRPSVDCRMFSLSLVDFDPVCSAAIHRVIDFYSR